MGVGRAGPVRGAVCSCATIVGGSPRGILDLMRGRGRGSLGVADGTYYHSADVGPDQANANSLYLSREEGKEKKEPTKTICTKP